MVKGAKIPSGERDRYIGVYFKADPAVIQMLRQIAGGQRNQGATLRRLIREEHARMVAQLKAKEQK